MARVSSAGSTYREHSTGQARGILSDGTAHSFLPALLDEPSDGLLRRERRVAPQSFRFSENPLEWAQGFQQRSAEKEAQLRSRSADTRQRSFLCSGSTLGWPLCCCHRCWRNRRQSVERKSERRQVITSEEVAPQCRRGERLQLFEPISKITFVGYAHTVFENESIAERVEVRGHTVLCIIFSSINFN